MSPILNLPSLVTAAGLSDADCTIQAAEFASPLKWHLGHTAWFFDKFLFGNDTYDHIFNSYYNAVGPQHARGQRGLLSRPALSDLLVYHENIMRAVAAVPAELPIVKLGLAHMEQHAELMITDWRYNSSFIPGVEAPSPSVDSPAHIQRWLVPVSTRYNADVGHPKPTLDCNGPRHRVILYPYEISNRPVLVREFEDFLMSDDYYNPLLWLSAAPTPYPKPLYWEEQLQSPNAPVSNLSYYQADAYARWTGARLPTEHEWEIASYAYPDPINRPLSLDNRPQARLMPTFFGDVWEWTSSPFTPYPRFKPSELAPEYNGKFMANQFVLKGSSCATPFGHSDHSYRNFFEPTAQWQFTGLRLARDI